jgi:UDP-glucose 4-epimerase
MDEFLALAYAKEHKLPVVLVRLFNTVGPRQVGRYGMVLPRFVQAALAGKPITIYGDGTQVRSFCHVKDVIRALLFLIEDKKAEGEIFNVGNDQPITISDLAQKVKDFTASRSKIVTIPYEKAFGKTAADFEEIQCRVPNMDKLYKTIRFTPEFDTDSIIRDIIGYYRNRKNRNE